MFLISLKAGGFGLNLTEADYCFLLDPWWNPATEAQAVDRTHRIGQTRNVMVYRLVAADTIEEKVMALKARKAQLFSSVMDQGTRSAPPSTPTTSAPARLSGTPGHPGVLVACPGTHGRYSHRCCEAGRDGRSGIGERAVAVCGRCLAP